MKILLKEARSWNKGVLDTFYENLGTKLNDFALFSLMQHYNLPTPLLAFTTDFNIALYFAFWYTRLQVMKKLIIMLPYI